ncbi:uncharacterized protein PHALS_01424 [Plasmopara halstedii]|uniref:Uncharacterized protein n=1 Tax=Plasmopara halstedii TaxID=4781 RepID=A0A0P1ATA8_PLAHL|nr:uncharacterized protein PHALS_01424 [Plasmopara halstedii]CEG45100.1 hypothetical protein PHALS_01424 [Plasmopara halstedii]|eukprot:XP_024581469.1 hypothetical protein PHALS_01424 [Plasmopara halstedii]
MEGENRSFVLLPTNQENEAIEASYTIDNEQEKTVRDPHTARNVRVQSPTMEERANDSGIHEWLKGIQKFSAFRGQEKFFNSEKDTIQELLKVFEIKKQLTLMNLITLKSVVKDVKAKRVPELDKGFIDARMKRLQSDMDLTQVQLHYARRRQNLLNDLFRDSNDIGKFDAMINYYLELLRLQNNMKFDLKNIHGEEGN